MRWLGTVVVAMYSTKILYVRLTRQCLLDVQAVK
jgi:hypothetical protein